MPFVIEGRKDVSFSEKEERKSRKVLEKKINSAEKSEK